MSDIKPGDRVTCIDKEHFGVYGVAIKQYFPTGAEQQTMIECYNGLLFHAPTRMFQKSEVIWNGKSKIDL